MTETQQKFEEVEWTVPEVGDVVDIVTENRRKCKALVVAVHGAGWKPQQEGDRSGLKDHTSKGYGPAINVVFVSDDENKRDPYGNQLERYSSLSHYNSATTMPYPGRYWLNAV